MIQKIIENENNKYIMQPIYGLTFGITNNVIKKAVVQALKNAEFEKSDIYKMNGNKKIYEA